MLATNLAHWVKQHGQMWVKLTILAGLLFGLDLRSSMAQNTTTVNNQRNQVWFGAFDPVYRGRRGWQSELDQYLAMVTSDKEWPIGANALNVFTIFSQFAERAPDDQIRKVLDFVQSHNKKLALSTRISPFGHNDCGHNPYIESYVETGVIKKNVDRIKRLGGMLSYVEMDEPVWFGHEFNGKKNACHDSLAAIASGLRTNIADIREAFPNVEIGEVEPITGTRQDWVNTMVEWLPIYRKTIGKPLAFVHWDVSWSNPTALTQLKALSRQIGDKAIRIGVIYNGDATDTGGTEFTAKAEQRSQRTPSLLGHQPDAIFESWVRYPEKLLPEDEPGTLTNLLKNYVQRRPG